MPVDRLDDVENLAAEYRNEYNELRLHSSLESDDIHGILSPHNEIARRTLL
jgi:hypothetical protein